MALPAYMANDPAYAPSGPAPEAGQTVEHPAVKQSEGLLAGPGIGPMLGRNALRFGAGATAAGVTDAALVPTGPVGAVAAPWANAAAFYGGEHAADYVLSDVFHLYPQRDKLDMSLGGAALEIGTGGVFGNIIEGTGAVLANIARTKTESALMGKTLQAEGVTDFSGFLGVVSPKMKPVEVAAQPRVFAGGQARAEKARTQLQTGFQRTAEATGAPPATDSQVGLDIQKSLNRPATAEVNAYQAQIAGAPDLGPTVQTVSRSALSMPDKAAFDAQKRTALTDVMRVGQEVVKTTPQVDSQRLGVSIGKALDDYQGKASQGFESAMDSLPGLQKTKLDTIPLHQALTSDQMQEVTQGTQAARLVQAAKNLIYSTNKDGEMKLMDNVDFNDARLLRSNIMKVLRRSPALEDSPDGAALYKLKGSIEDTINQSAEKTAGNQIGAWRAANSDYRQSQDYLRVLKSAWRNPTPEDRLRVLSITGEGNVSKLQALKETLPGPVWDEYATLQFRNLGWDNQASKYGKLDAQSLVDGVKRLDTKAYDILAPPGSVRRGNLDALVEYHDKLMQSSGMTLGQHPSFAPLREASALLDTVPGGRTLMPVATAPNASAASQQVLTSLKQGPEIVQAMEPGFQKLPQARIDFQLGLGKAMFLNDSTGQPDLLAFRSNWGGMNQAAKNAAFPPGDPLRTAGDELYRTILRGTPPTEQEMAVERLLGGLTMDTRERALLGSIAQHIKPAGATQDMLIGLTKGDPVTIKLFQGLSPQMQNAVRRQWIDQAGRPDAALPIYSTATFRQTYEATKPEGFSALFGNTPDLEALVKRQYSVAKAAEGSALETEGHNMFSANAMLSVIGGGPVIRSVVGSSGASVGVMDKLISNGIVARVINSDGFVRKVAQIKESQGDYWARLGQTGRLKKIVTSALTTGVPTGLAEDATLSVKQNRAVADALGAAHENQVISDARDQMKGAGADLREFARRGEDLDVAMSIIAGGPDGSGSGEKAAQAYQKSQTSYKQANDYILQALSFANTTKDPAMRDKALNRAQAIAGRYNAQAAVSQKAG